MDRDFTIRGATTRDAADLAAIYAPYVLDGIATFETEPPTADDFAARIAKVLGAGHPWLIAQDRDGAALGYAYASPIRERAAYRHTAENSIYLREDCAGRGIGTALLARLMAECESCGFRQMIAVIAGPGAASVALHERAGFEKAGHMRSTGRKHGKWIDVVYMQRALGEGDTSPPQGELP